MLASSREKRPRLREIQRRDRAAGNSAECSGASNRSLSAAKWCNASVHRAPGCCGAFESQNHKLTPVHPSATETHTSGLTPEQIKGIRLTELARWVAAIGEAAQSHEPVLNIHARRFPHSLYLYLYRADFETTMRKAAIGSATPAAGDWGSALVPGPIARTFVEAASGVSAVGRLDLVPVPFNTRTIADASGASAAWDGSGTPDARSWW